MADLQRRLDDLRQQVSDLASRASREDITDEVTRLERVARELLSDAKNTPQEAAAQALFAEVARLTNPISPTAATVRGLLRRARIRIEIAGDEDDIDEAIDILAEALALNPHDESTIALLQDAASRTPHSSQRVGDLFARHNVEQPALAEVVASPDFETIEVAGDGDEELPAPPRYPTSSGYPPPEENLYPKRQTQSTRRVPGQGPLYNGTEIDDMLSDLTQAYYAGEYQQTVEVANRILSLQPGNHTALEYREKAEDNLIRGVVPDHRIPFDARVSYNRANSLVRAGNYEEAERLYREARDLAERSGILSWKDAEQAMLDIQDLALARELLNEGDRLMATDNWSDALRKYEGALRVVPNDPQAEERVEIVRRVQHDADQAAVQLSMLSGTMPDQVTQLQNVQTILARVRQLLPNSQRLAQLLSDANNKLNAIKTQIHDQAQSALTRARNAISLDERLLLSNEALRLLELGVELDPGDQRLSELMIDARAMSSDAQRAKHVVERASALIAQNFDTELAQARTMLAELRDYAQDERYRVIVNDLLSRYIERAEIALEDGDIGEAQSWLETTREEPFRMLGRRAEVQRLENQLRREKQRNRLVMAAATGGVIIVLGIAAFFSRDQWVPIINPPPTPTPSVTPTPSDTPTPSVTPTASSTATDTPTPTITHTPTDTPTPTWTVTPSLTVTPSETPTETYTPTHTPTLTATETATASPTMTFTPTITLTPTMLCEVIVTTADGANLRLQPSTGATRITTLPRNIRMEVFEQGRERGIVWYRIRTRLEGNALEGWVRSDTVEVIGSPCEEIPE